MTLTTLKGLDQGKGTSESYPLLSSHPYQTQGSTKQAHIPQLYSQL